MSVIDTLKPKVCLNSSQSDNNTKTDTFYITSVEFTSSGFVDLFQNAHCENFWSFHFFFKAKLPMVIIYTDHHRLPAFIIAKA